MQGQYNAKPTVTFPVALTGSTLVLARSRHRAVVKVSAQPSVPPHHTTQTNSLPAHHMMSTSSELVVMWWPYWPHVQQASVSSLGHAVPHCSFLYLSPHLQPSSSDQAYPTSLVPHLSTALHGVPENSQTLSHYNYTRQETTPDNLWQKYQEHFSAWSQPAVFKELRDNRNRFW